MLDTLGATNANYTVKQILKDNWDDFKILYNGNIRQTVLDNVERIINCSNADILGYNTYACGICGNKHIVAHTCKSRFCNKCGKIANENWIVKAQDRLINMPHKHLVFTVPYELRLLFATNRSLLSILFKATNTAILEWAETKNFLPGVVTVLHTFGSKLNFNCHIHVLYSLGGLNTKTLRCKFEKFIPAISLKKRFKACVLAELRSANKNKKLIIPTFVSLDWQEKFGTDNFYEVQNHLYQKDWYNWVGEELDNTDLTVKYIGRYAKRPCLAEYKIIYYSKQENIVKFRFKDKETKTEKVMTMDIMTFIGHLVRHIPEKGFQMIRYAGIYANARKKKCFKLIADTLTQLYGIARLLFQPTARRAVGWRQIAKGQNQPDPLSCPKCKVTMFLLEVAYRARDGTMKHKIFNM